MTKTHAHWAVWAFWLACGSLIGAARAEEARPAASKSQKVTQAAKRARPARTAAAPAPGATFAVCDVVFVFDRYERARDETRKIEASSNALQRENRKRLEQIRRAKAELDHVKDDDKKREALQAKVKKLETDREAWTEREQARHMRYHHRLTREMYAEIVETIARLAQAKGIPLVLQVRRAKPKSKNTLGFIREIRARQVIYAAAPYDITDEVLRRLNAAYRKTKPRKPATKPGKDDDL